MNFCRGFITDPKILFLDEPTLGLDVTAARRIRAFIREWMKEEPGRTLLLTTHYMAEADELCDRLAIIDRGKVLACDTPAEPEAPGAGAADLRAEPGAGGERRGPTLAELPGVHRRRATDDADDGGTEGVAGRGAGDRRRWCRRLADGGGRILSLKKVEPTLEDVFIELVGHGLEEDRRRTRLARPEGHA